MVDHSTRHSAFEPSSFTYSALPAACSPTGDRREDLRVLVVAPAIAALGAAASVRSWPRRWRSTSTWRSSASPPAGRRHAHHPARAADPADVPGAARPGPAVHPHRPIGGSLWLVLDQSGSMDQADPQARPEEKLRWADAAGLLPPNFRPAPWTVPPSSCSPCGRKSITSRGSTRPGRGEGRRKRWMTW